MILAAGLAFVALILVARMSEKLRAVNARLDSIQARLQRAEQLVNRQPVPAGPPPAPSPAVPVEPAAARPAGPLPRTVPGDAAAHPAPTPAAPLRAAAPPKRDLETEIGSRWVLVVGVVVLVLGVAFFVKYAFDRHWISETLRVAAGTLAGAAVFAAGLALSQRGYVLYGRMIAGGGLAILYVSAYAAGALYGLVSSGVMVGWMAALSALTVVAADRQRAPGLAVMAIALAFAAPFLVLSRQDHHVVLFVYDAALVAGALLLVRRHAWVLLAMTSAGFTWATFAAWAALSYRPSYFAATEAYLTAATLMILLMTAHLRGSRHPLAPLVRLVPFAASSLYHAASVAVLFNQSFWFPVYLIAINAVGVAWLKDRPWRRLLLWLAVAGPFLAWLQAHETAAWYVATLATAIGLYALHLTVQLRHFDRGERPPIAELVLFHLNGLGLFAWTFPTVYAHSASTPALTVLLSTWNAVLALRSYRRGPGTLMPHGLALSFTFAAIAVAIRLAGPWMTVAWAAEGAAVVWVGLAIRRAPLRYGGVGLLVLAIARLVWLYFGETLVSFTLFLNERMATGAFIVALLYVGAALHRRYRDALAGNPNLEPALFVAAANVLTIALLTADIASFWEVRGEEFSASFKRELSTSVTWGVYGMGLLGLGFRRRAAVLRYLGLALLGLTVCKLFAVDLLTLDGIYRIAGFLVLGVVLLAASFLYQRARRRESLTEAPAISTETAGHTAGGG